VVASASELPPLPLRERASPKLPATPRLAGREGEKSSGGAERRREGEVEGRVVPGSIVISALQEVDAAWANQVDETMLLSDAPGPGSGCEMLERFWLPDAVEGISDYRFDEIEDFEGGSSILSDPPTKVFQKLLLEDAFSRRSQDGIFGG
jgi:hypothetical protein